MEEKKFTGIKNTLDNMMKSMSKKGNVQPQNQAIPLTEAEEEKLWQNNILGEDSPEQLVNTVLFLFGIHFVLHGGDEHKSLKVGCTQQISIKTDTENDLQYLEYKACHTKNNQGGLRDRKCQQKVVHTYENVNNKKRCIVRLYQKYLGLHPNNHPKCS